MKALENLKRAIFPDEHDSEPTIKSMISSVPDDIKREQNIQSQMRFAETKELLAIQDSDRELINPFTGKIAIPEQLHDLLNFRAIGKELFSQRIQYYILWSPSVCAPTRRQRLQTFSQKKPTKQRISQLERDKKLVQTCIRKKLHWSKQTGRAVERPGEQFIELPLALSDHEGNPIKGQKSYTTRAYNTRYKNNINITPIITQEFPAG